MSPGPLVLSLPMARRSRSQLERRIVSILKPHRPRPSTIVTAVMLTAITGLGISAAVAHPARISSAGRVAVVENARPPDGSRLGWRIGPQPVVSIGGGEGGDAYMFSDASDATILRDGRIVVVNRGTSELRVFDPSGTHVARTPAQAHVDAYIEVQVSGMPSEMVANRAELRGYYQSVPVADRLPAFATIMSDAVDHLWVEEFEVPGEERPGTLWTVFDAEGHVLGFVETPEGLEIHEIGEDYILGRVEDEFGVDFIQVWPLVR